MGKAQKAPAITGAIILLAVVVIAAAGVATVLTRGHTGHSPPAAVAPVATPVQSAEPYAARPGANGTKTLTETIDPVSLAVPEDWKTPVADAQTLPADLDAFGTQAPSLASILHTEADFAGKGAIRLFAYRPTSPFAFVSVTSYAQPSAAPLTPDLVAAAVAAAKKKSRGAAVSGVQLPLGLAIKVDTNFVSQKQPVVVEFLVLVQSGRRLIILLVSETNVPALPQVFDQIAQSLGQK
jgi:hypothetical protein